MLKKAQNAISSRSQAFANAAELPKIQDDGSSKFYKYLIEGKLIDVILSAEGEFLPGHKVILSARSVWFEVS